MPLAVQHCGAGAHSHQAPAVQPTGPAQSAPAEPAQWPAQNAPAGPARVAPSGPARIAPTAVLVPLPRPSCAVSAPSECG
jgi:hypothetical protein